MAVVAGLLVGVGVELVLPPPPAVGVDVGAEVGEGNGVDGML